MKLRQGFVSNSSSSSFVLIATKEAWEKGLENLTDFEKDILEQLEEDISEKKVLGKDCIVFWKYNNAGWSSTEELSPNMELFEEHCQIRHPEITEKEKEELIEYCSDEVYQALYKLEELVKELNKEDEFFIDGCDF